MNGNANNTTIAPITSQVNADTASGNTATTNQTFKNANNATIAPITSQVNADTASGSSAATNNATTNVTVKNANNATVMPGVNLLFADKAPGGNKDVRRDLAPGTLSSNVSSERSNKGGELRGLDRANQVAGEHGQQGRDFAAENQSHHGSQEVGSDSRALSRNFNDVRHMGPELRQDLGTNARETMVATDRQSLATDLKDVARDQSAFRADKTDVREVQANRPEKPQRRDNR
ncbi:MAG TPA: hypothetical protein VGQ08_13820 [Nitrospiraceae bacterium]|nr:hypothetical protein [Nitrospiraceae bacterium]